MALIDYTMIHPNEIDDILFTEEFPASAVASNVEHIIECHSEDKDFYLRKFAEVIIKISQLVEQHKTLNF